MKAFIRETSPAIAVPGVNCDTDQILPGRFLKYDRLPDGYGGFLFHDIRRDADGALDPAFPMNRPEAEAAKILLVEDNFGCGSSREGAVYAIVDAGFRAVVAPSFGDIFYNNALKNGLVPVRLPVEVCDRLSAHVTANPAAEITVDLEAAEIRLPGNLGTHPIVIDAFARECILKGLDEMEMTFTYMDRIREFEAGRMAANPWLDR